MDTDTLPSPRWARALVGGVLGGGFGALLGLKFLRFYFPDLDAAWLAGLLGGAVLGAAANVLFGR